MNTAVDTKMRKPGAADRLVLLTGATGYVGGRLLGPLERSGLRVRCMARRPQHLAGKVAEGTEIVPGDCLQPESLQSALTGVDTAFYLVHSMGAHGDFADRDREAALNFGRAAADAGVRRIVYLGGLSEADEPLSEHLRSRLETGDALRSAGVPVIELRASIIIGSGSLSFELIRALVERLPVMICPQWVATLAQPIAIEDVVAYLLESIDLDSQESRVLEIGGADRLSYGGLMLEYARQRGLKRRLINVPALTPRLSSLWLGLTTPLYARVGRKLIESIRNPSVVTDTSASSAFTVRPMTVREAISRAMINEDSEFAETRWSSAMSSSGDSQQWGGVVLGTRIVDSRCIDVPSPASRAFLPIERIGGSVGWYYADQLWRIRGFIDLLLGGVGMRRGRRNQESPSVGDEIDFWRVEAYEPGQRLRLAAEMKLPGRAWLEFEVEPTTDGSRIRQTAVFDPWGLAGLAYWYLIYPLHALIFKGMLRRIAGAGV